MYDNKLVSAAVAVIETAGIIMFDAGNFFSFFLWSVVLLAMMRIEMREQQKKNY